MAVGDFLHALDGVFMYGTAGSTAATESTNVTGCSLGRTSKTEDTQLRGEVYESTHVLGLQTTLTFTAYNIDSDGLVAALLAAPGNLIALYPTDKASGEGLDADYVVTQATRDETDLTKWNFECKPNSTNRVPVWT